ncbi:BspA family leucine-rich repeat surface protein [Carnobacterium maltaromaticum]|uniref:BspA family leucine-rich repeat surface protein n=1 Tax=Carnobacterium maltaromaticum TaxID=2751 RepID=UPI00191BC733|nr:BspA family leucine-rich repeat surface protein [Carnobacterium maltaromaticum]CAD5898193.1 exported hypothetical protein [Carnobacterium maltaromaticum]
MKKKTTLIGLGLILSSSILPAVAQAETIIVTPTVSSEETFTESATLNTDLDSSSSVLLDSIESGISNEEVKVNQDLTPLESTEPENVTLITNELEAGTVYEAESNETGNPLAEENSVLNESETITTLVDRTAVWAGLTLTLDDDGTLHIPEGTINRAFLEQELVKVFPVEDVKKISIDGKLAITGNFEYLFDGFTNVTSIENLSYLDFSNATSIYGMFINCSSLESVDMSGVDMSNVTDLADMFARCSSLRSVDLSNWDTSNVTRTAGLFFGCSSLESVDLSNWDTSNVTFMAIMFSGCGSLKNVDLSNWDTSNVTSMINLFKSCSALKNLTLSKNIQFTVDTDLPPISEDDVYTGFWQNIGTGTVENPKGTNVWTSDELMANYNGLTDADTYVWQKKSPGTSAYITVHYVDINGNSIADLVTLSGTVGEAYSSEQKEINGYTFKEVQGDTTGTFTESVQSITYIYMKDNVSPTVPTVPTVPPTPTIPTTKPNLPSFINTGTGMTALTENVTNTSEFPQTGNKEAIWTMKLGASLLALVSVFYFFKRKKERNIS